MKQNFPYRILQNIYFVSHIQQLQKKKVLIKLQIVFKEFKCINNCVLFLFRKCLQTI